MDNKIKKVLYFITNLIIFAVLFHYFWKRIDPRLIDFKQQPIFLFDLNFLSYYLIIPGGMAQYLSLFISQFFHFAVAGALLIVLVLYFIMGLTGKLLSIFFPSDYTFILKFIPVFLLVYLHSQYSCTLKPDIIIIISLLLTIVNYNFINKSNILKIAIFLIFSIFSIMLFGSISLMLFSFLTILLEVRNKKGGYITLILLYIIAVAVFTFIIGASTPYMTFKKSLFDIFVAEKYYKPYLIFYPLFIFYPLVMLLGLIFSDVMLSSKFIENIKRSKLFIIVLIINIIPIGLLFYILIISYNNNDKALIELNYYAENKEWHSVLQTGEKLSFENRLVLFQINRALYHQGILLEDLFTYNQIWGEDGLILTRRYNSKILMPISDYFFDLGFIKESLHWAYEAMTKYELQPVVLKRIIQLNLILGDYKISEKFLSILSKSIIHRKWAKHYQEYLHNKDLIESDPVIQKKRDLMPKHDYFAILDEPAHDLYNLLQENPKNRAAFEYYIALFLLKHDIGNVVKNLHYLSELNYSHIPRYIEEAILLYSLMQKDKDVQLGSYHVSNMTVEMFNKYNTIFVYKYKNNLGKAKPLLTEYFSNTFWYYLHYVSPITTKKEIRKRMIE